MAWLNDWRRRERPLLGLLLALLVPLLVPTVALAQAPADYGLKGEYYNGADFDEFVLSRRDATIAFDWAHRPPAPGVTAEYFSVRWTGWLLAPASGRYLFHVTVDDGMRIWLNNKLILDEWRPQPVRSFTASAELRAGQFYRLRVEYFQDILDTRAQLTWERPDLPKGPPAASWHNLWGVAADKPAPEPIPARYLFSRNPRLASALPAPPLVKAPPAPPKLPAVVKASPKTPPAPTQPGGRPSELARRPPVPALPQIVAAVPLPRVVPVPVVGDSGGTARLVRLAVGEALTLPELYFRQGQALLLPAARAALDSLAATLSARPALRFEVQGHTDNVGDAELNRQLSQQRAEAVCLYLTAHGAAAGQLRPVGYGGTRPVADNADPAQRPRNRRVVLQRR